MKVSAGETLVFIATFFSVIVLDYLFFVGIFTQVPTEKTSWLLNNFFSGIIIFFWLFLGMPALISYLITFKLFFQAKEYLTQEEIVMKEASQAKFVIITTLIFAALIFILSKTVAKPKLAPYTLKEISESELSEPSSSPSPGESMFPSETPKSSGTPSPTPIATPGRTPNPPIINISYPTEMQSIEMTGGQSLCLVDTPAGGDTTGIQRKYNINDQGWSNYTDLFTLCFEPQEGLNRVQLQYKNSLEDESTVYTRQFSFHRLLDITVSISGQIFEDKNCNKVRDSGEENIDVSTPVRMFKMPEFYVYEELSSNSDGTFDFSTAISEKESITLEPAVQSPPGYKVNPHYYPPSFTLNSDNRHASLEFPQIPYEFVGVCY